MLETLPSILITLVVSVSIFEFLKYSYKKHLRRRPYKRLQELFSVEEPKDTEQVLDVLSDVFMDIIVRVSKPFFVSRDKVISGIVLWRYDDKEWKAGTESYLDNEHVCIRSGSRFSTRLTQLKRTSSFHVIYVTENGHKEKHKVLTNDLAIVSEEVIQHVNQYLEKYDIKDQLSRLIDEKIDLLEQGKLSKVH